MQSNVKDQYDYVIHLASVKTDSANKNFKTNVFGTMNVIGNVKANHFLYVSSEDAESLKDVYDMSKHFGHLVAAELCAEKNIKYSMLVLDSNKTVESNIDLIMKCIAK